VSQKTHKLENNKIIICKGWGVGGGSRGVGSGGAGSGRWWGG